MVLTPLDVVATNVAGFGAVELAVSLLPTLEEDPRLAVERIYLPDRGPLTAYHSAKAATVATRRRLPNSISRLLECTVGAGRFNRGVPLLVLGDLPLAVDVRQTVVVQTPHLLSRFSTARGSDAVKYAFMRTIFRANAGRAAAIIVQSVVMRDAILAEYAVAAERVHIVQQPPPAWLLDAPPAAPHAFGERLQLFYPAAGYPHKNHALLGRVEPEDWNRLVNQLVLTLPREAHPVPAVKSIRCVGHLDPAAMRMAYAAADALLFPSVAESYGFPLVEAMWLGLPIVVADLPYAHALCGNQAIYFDPSDDAALIRALSDLRSRLGAGWRPDWREQLAPIPRDWATVAAQLAAIIIG